MKQIEIECPVGTSCLAVEPWAKGEIYAVAANWAEASSPILGWGNSGWTHIGLQVADYRHSAVAALKAVIAQAIAMSEGIPSADVDEDDVDTIIAQAQGI